MVPLHPLINSPALDPLDLSQPVPSDSILEKLNIAPGVCIVPASRKPQSS